MGASDEHCTDLPVLDTEPVTTDTVLRMFVFHQQPVLLLLLVVRLLPERAQQAVAQQVAVVGMRTVAETRS